MVGCNQTPSRDKIDNDFVGIWDVTFKNLPEHGDVKVKMNLNSVDSLINGYFIDPSELKIKLDQIKLKNESLRAKFKWSGHNVMFKINLVEGDNTKLEGSFMGFFDIEGTKLN